MKSQNLKLFSVVFGISLLGSLPIGTLNASIIHYTLKQDFLGAFQFGLGAILVEALAVRLSIIFIPKLQGLKKLVWIIYVIAFLVILFLALRTLEAAYQMRDFYEVLPFLGGSAFLSGLSLSFINPLHIPFWSGWTLVLKEKNLLEFRPQSLNIYVIALSIGTGSAFLLYGIFGNILLSFFKEGHNLINWIICFTLFFTSLVIAYRLWVSPYPFKAKLIRTS